MHTGRARRKQKIPMTITEGIVLRERPVGEQDKFIDILTKDNGVIEVSVKGARKINGKSGSSTQLFAYSRFCVNESRGRLVLNSAEPIHIFYGLRDSLTKLSLASYFAEVAVYCTPERSETEGRETNLRLLLNCLHYLENDLRPEALLRSIFELRLMADTGYMPDILGCRGCGVFEPEELFFCISDGGFYCADCFTSDGEDHSGTDYMKVGLPVLNAVRHIVLADFDRLFNFRISDKVQSALTEFSSSYITAHLEKHFKTLDFYKSLL